MFLFTGRKKRKRLVLFVVAVFFVIVWIWRSDGLLQNSQYVETLDASGVGTILDVCVFNSEC